MASRVVIQGGQFENTSGLATKVALSLLGDSAEVRGGTVVDGEPRALSESLEARTFADEQIPWDELAFYSTAEALRDYLAAERGAGRGLSRNLR